MPVSLDLKQGPWLNLRLKGKIQCYSMVSVINCLHPHVFGCSLSHPIPSNLYLYVARASGSKIRIVAYKESKKAAFPESKDPMSLGTT